jgi:hypothetical protein
MIIKKTFSFSDKHSEVIKHLEAQGNASDYIRRLVAQDMQHSNLHAIIEDIIEQKLSRHSNHVPDTNGLKDFLGGM